MSSPFDDFGLEEDDSATGAGDTRPVDDAGYLGHESYGRFPADDDTSDIFQRIPAEEPPLGFPINDIPKDSIPPSPFNPLESKEKGYGGGIFNDGLPSEEGSLLRDWRR